MLRNPVVNATITMDRLEVLRVIDFYLKCTKETEHV
jgi:hypothetical protein